jgi:hypothetical protein
MFIHIGNNYLLKKDEIIAAFNVQSLMADPKGRKFVTELKQGNKFIDISEGKWASIILTDGPTYVSRISTSTLRSRSGEDIGDVLVSARRPGGKKKG